VWTSESGSGRRKVRRSCSSPNVVRRRDRGERISRSFSTLFMHINGEILENK